MSSPFYFLRALSLLQELAEADIEAIMHTIMKTRVCLCQTCDRYLNKSNRGPFHNFSLVK